MRSICFLFLLLFAKFTIAQALFSKTDTFTEEDSLRGSLNKDRTCFDVHFYHLDVKVDPDSQFISGSNTIAFEVVHSFKRMQLDLFQNMQINAVMQGEVSLDFVRHHNAFYVYFDDNPVKGEMHEITVYYEGKPTVAEHAPWDGGFVWEKDSSENHWVGVACQGFGASSWWPNKDHLSDEPDSMLISVTVPDNLMDVSNGQFLGVEAPQKGWKKYNWKVSYPINNYNVTLNIADYTHFTDTFQRGESTETLDYYVLKDNLEKARKQFEQVKPMLRCYEEYLGVYPFWKDGYKLVETPYLGMEHQSAIAYGNEYKTGYAGHDYSRIGLDFDYIIIHETGHEWWGNAVSVADIADLWIHEGFCTYSEAIYVECMFDKTKALEYINAKKPGVKNKKSILGIPGVNHEGAGDMYNKGMLILNTLRSLVEDDELWWNTIRGLVEEFSYRTTNTEEVVAYLSKALGKDLKDFFGQYLAFPDIPVFEYKLDRSRKSANLSFRWKADVEAFDMPIIIRFGKEEKWIFPKTGEWKSMEISLGKKDQFSVAEELFYVGVKEVE